MAKNKSTVYLGYEDEEINSKHTTFLNSTVNKIGGSPDWPMTEIKIPNCPLCSGVRPMIVQLYAPLENSQFHRTLYIFACLNPSCSNNSKSWLCIRIQQMDKSSNYDGQNAAAPQANKNRSLQQKISWCGGADDWDIDSMEDDSLCDATFQSPNNTEENGNLIEKTKNDNSPRGGTSDDDDESNSMENDIVCDFGNLQMMERSGITDAEDDNKNANSGMVCGGASGGSVGAFGTVNVNATGMCFAEIEGGETDVVYVESPKAPERDLIALLKQTSTSLGPLSKISDLTLKPFFLAVDLADNSNDCTLSVDHIRELYQEYNRQDELQASSMSKSPSPTASGGGAVGGVAAEQDQEMYEKSIPAHGDLMFYRFLSTIQSNPGQILRYSRDTLPLLTAPLCEPVPKCQHCNGETICEVQLLSTMIPKLKIQQNNDPAPIEYGNVLTFTCLKSCWDTPDKMRYEKIIVQQEI